MFIFKINNKKIVCIFLCIKIIKEEIEKEQLKKKKNMKFIEKVFLKICVYSSFKATTSLPFKNTMIVHNCSQLIK